MKKRLVAMLLVLSIVCSFPISVFAASDEATQAAQALHELGLFNGVGTNADGTPIFELDRTPTRHEAITMLVNLLGKGEEARLGTWETPFTDVEDWAKPYVGYAYTNKLTGGTSNTTFGGEETVTAAQYITFVLLALGYTSGTDFRWDKSWELADQIGLTDGRYNAETKDFTRGDVAIVSNRALSVATKGSEKLLIEALGLKVAENTIEESLQGFWMGIGDLGDGYECAEYYNFEGTSYSCAYVFIDADVNPLGSGYEEGTFIVKDNVIILNRTAMYVYTEDGNNTTISDESESTEYKLTTNFDSNEFYMNDWRYLKEHDDFQPKSVYGKIKERVLAHISAIQSNELTSAEKETIDNKLAAAQMFTLGATEGMGIAMASCGQLLLGNITGGLRYSQRVQLERDIRDAENVVAEALFHAVEATADIRKILSTKADASDVCQKLREFETLCADVVSIGVTTDSDKIIEMGETTTSALNLLSEISRIIQERY